ncbi:hypothetical protein GJAV_G00158550 [Gymnothorax javanicus]|nr:hypothetical protein GJAV_G00158550 [Gymnothorax javanicus]
MQPSRPLPSYHPSSPPSTLPPPPLESLLVVIFATRWRPFQRTECFRTVFLNGVLTPPRIYQRTFWWINPMISLPDGHLRATTHHST